MSADKHDEWLKSHYDGQPEDAQLKSHGEKMSASEIKPYTDRATENSGMSRPMTFGEKLVGLTFNPSNDDKVAKAKKLCAELMDLVNEEKKNRETTQLENILYNHTVGEILNAQMNVVKLITLKY
jgi:hypothetical protein